jgi:hypothetical protein
MVIFYSFNFFSELLYAVIFYIKMANSYVNRLHVQLNSVENQIDYIERGKIDLGCSIRFWRFDAALSVMFAVNNFLADSLAINLFCCLFAVETSFNCIIRR